MTQGSPRTTMTQALSSRAFRPDYPAFTLGDVVEQINAMLVLKGEVWKMEEWMEKPMQWMVSYYNPSPQFPKLINKGFVLMGNPGRGKTLVMRAFNTLANPYDKAYFLESEFLTEAFEEGGWNHPKLKKLKSERYTHRLAETSTGSIVKLILPMNINIDEIGREKQVFHKVGNQIKSKMTDVVPDIIHKRYTMYEQMGARIYGTTNLSDSQIFNSDGNGRYDERTYSRIRGMIDFVPWGIEEDSRDFRQQPNLLK